MEIYNSLSDYLPKARVNDTLVFCFLQTIHTTLETMDKFDTCRFKGITDDGKVIIKGYKAKQFLFYRLHEYNIPVIALTDKEFFRLPYLASSPP